MAPSNPFPPGSFVAFYGRDSGGDRQDLSVQQQVDYFRSWCAENRVTPGMVFTDLARVGGTTVGRDELDRMLRYFQSTHLDIQEEGVVFWDYSRLARDYDDGQFILSTLRRQGYTVTSLKENIPEGSVGKLIEGLYLWNAQQYREQLSENVKRGMRYLVTVLKCWPVATPPTGYLLIPVSLGTRRDGSPHTGRRLVPDPDRAPRVRQAFEMAAARASLSEINREIGGLFSDVTGVARMLRNRIYIGEMVYLDTVTPNFCEPLVSQALFQKAQDARRAAGQRRGPHHPRAVHSPYLLSGLISCARCGSQMIGNRFHDHRYYLCWKVPSHTRDGTCDARGVNAALIENRVIDLLLQSFSKPDVLQRMYEQAARINSQMADREQEIVRAKKELAEVGRQIKRVTQAIAGRPRSEALFIQLDELEKTRDATRERINKLEASRTEPPADLSTLGAMQAELRAKLEVANLRQRQLVLRALNVKVVAARVGETRDASQFAGSVSFQIFPGLPAITITL